MLTILCIFPPLPPPTIFQNYKLDEKEADDVGKFLTSSACKSE
jgi:hypothetical protein